MEIENEYQTLRKIIKSSSIKTKTFYWDSQGDISTEATDEMVTINDRKEQNTFQYWDKPVRARS